MVALTKQNIQKNIEIDFEDIIWKYKIVICVIFAIIISVLYKLGIIRNIKENLGNIGVLLSAIMVVVSFVLTVLMYLYDRENFRKAISRFGVKNGKDVVFQYFFRVIISCIACIFIVIAIGVLYLPFMWLKLIISFAGATVFCYSLIGSVYMLFFSIDIVANINKTEKNKKVK